MNHRYDEVFLSIIQTVKNDYAGFAEKKKRHDADSFYNAAGSAYRQGRLDELTFLRIVCQYLASLGDPCLRFSMMDHEGYQKYDAGFRVRRYGRDLYVTACGGDPRVAVGDKITKIGKISPGEQREKFRKNLLIGEPAEREQWGGFLKMTDYFTLEHADGSAESMYFRHFPPIRPADVLSFRSLSEDVCCICAETFEQDTEELEQLLKEHEKELRSCRGLILDLRRNEGGSESGFFPLLPLVIDAPADPASLLNRDPLWTNYSKENCRRMVRQLQTMKAQYEKEENVPAVEIADELIAEYKEKSGKGFLREPLEKETGGRMQPYENIEKVVLLTDTWCRDIGEEFVSIAAASSKVTTIGRPTMGTIDYTNYVSAVYDETYLFSYPMSKRQHVLDGKPCNDTGLPVDFYIPWTPEECREDILLQNAMEYLNS